MANAYTVKLYSATGFSGANIPDLPSLLNSASTVLTLSERYLKRQSLNLSSIKLPCTEAQVKNVDYMSISRDGEVVYYQVTGFKMTTPTTAVLSVSVDAITTLGGPSMVQWDGWATRAHARSDNLFENNAEEPFTQIDPWQYSEPVSLYPETEEDDLEVIGSTAAITDSGRGIVNVKGATVFENSTTGDKVVIPETRPPYFTCRFHIPVYQGSYLTKDFTWKAFGFYDASQTPVQDGTNILRGVGAEASIMFSYKLPAGYVSFTKSTTFTFSEIAGLLLDKDSELPFEWMSGIKNKKVFSGQFSRFVLTCPSAGNSEEYAADVISRPGDTSPWFIMFCDPSPEGRPYFRPISYHGNITDTLLAAVPGSNWSALPIAYANRSGESVDMANNAVYSNRSAERRNISALASTERFNIRQAMGTLRSAIGLGSAISTNLASSEMATLLHSEDIINAGGSLGSMYTDRQSFISAQNEMNDLLRSQLQQRGDEQTIKNATNPIELKFPFAAGLQNYGGNIGIVYHCHISENDARRMDDFFSAYGYATSEKMTSQLFEGRRNHNYVKANAACINDTAPMWLRNIASEQIAGGVRVWHVKPSITALYDNPIYP